MPAPRKINRNLVIERSRNEWNKKPSFQKLRLPIRPNLGGFSQVVHRAKLRLEGRSARSDQGNAERNRRLSTGGAPQLRLYESAGDAHFRWNLCAIRRGMNKNAPRRRNPAAIGSCAPLYSFDEKSAGPKPALFLFRRSLSVSGLELIAQTHTPGMNVKPSVCKLTAILARHSALKEGSGRAGGHGRPACPGRTIAFKVVIRVLGTEDPIPSWFEFSAGAEDKSHARLAGIAPHRWRHRGKTLAQRRCSSNSPYSRRRRKRRHRCHTAATG